MRLVGPGGGADTSLMKKIECPFITPKIPHEISFCFPFPTAKSSWSFREIVFLVAFLREKKALLDKTATVVGWPLGWFILPRSERKIHIWRWWYIWILYKCRYTYCWWTKSCTNWGWLIIPLFRTGFNHSRWCRISSINSMYTLQGTLCPCPTLGERNIYKMSQMCTLVGDMLLFWEGCCI